MMLSAFHTKFKALKSRLPQSSLDSPWRMALFAMVATVVILAGSLLMVTWQAFKAVILTDENSSPVEDNRPDGNGYKPGDFFYSKPGTMNPALASMIEEMNKSNGDGQ